MNFRSLIKMLTVLLMFVAVIVVAMPVLAAPPNKVTFPVAGSFVLAECDGFNVIDEYSGTLTSTVFLDNNGAVERSTLHINTHERVYNSVTRFEVFNSYAYNQAVEPATNEYFIRGEAYNITVPGYGIVYFDAGLGIFVLMDGEFVELQFSGNYQADKAVLCEAMDQ